MRATLCGLGLVTLTFALSMGMSAPAVAQSASIEQEWRILTDAQAAY